MAGAPRAHEMIGFSRAVRALVRVVPTAPRKRVEVSVRPRAPSARDFHTTAAGRAD
jgi:hypothetical protein